MKILVLNCGSSSIKFQLLEMNGELAVASGLVDRIGMDKGVLKMECGDGRKIKLAKDFANHEDGILTILDLLVDPEKGVIKSKSEIDVVGHRIVHGGEFFSGSVAITDEIIEKIESCIELAPLHNPANLAGINAMKKVLPSVPQCGTFDTAFHQTMPEISYLYAIPYEYYKKYKLRRYGFHGSSHRYVSQKAYEEFGLDPLNSKVISCHLGNGASVCAIKNGKSVETSMGFTPLEGMMMGTRSGNLDVGAVFFLMRKENLSVDEMDAVLNKKSGILGLTELSSDMRDIENAAWNEGNEHAQLALDMYAYRVRRYIGAYAAAMDGVDLIIFTGGIGENGPETREDICKELGWLGVDFDAEINAKKRGKLLKITKEESKVAVAVIPTNEELIIARDAKTIVDKK